MPKSNNDDLTPTAYVLYRCLQEFVPLGRMEDFVFQLEVDKRVFSSGPVDEATRGLALEFEARIRKIEEVSQRKCNDDT